jgi:predicted molibdopterin-dependent oxidoreductase YjgC
MSRESARVSSPIIRLLVDGRTLEARVGDSVASALLAAGIRTLREATDGSPRGLFCGIGVCFECLVTIDGSPGRRACMTGVRDGMTVTTSVPGP